MRKNTVKDLKNNLVEGKVCGFDAQEVFKLYAFVEAYEWSDIKQLKNETELLHVHPELRGLKECMKKVYFHKAKAENLNPLDISNFHNEIHGVKHGSLLLSFLYHLRNAIAHACVTKVDGVIQVTTFMQKRPTDFSARGRIDLEIIELFTNELKKVLL